MNRSCIEVKNAIVQRPQNSAVVASDIDRVLRIERKALAPHLEALKTPVSY
jgi:hypothetical protein